MALTIESVDGIETVGDLIAALENFPDNVPVRIGLSQALMVSRREPTAGDLAKYRRGYILLQEARDGC